VPCHQKTIPRLPADEQELAELKDMWNRREISTREYRQMCKTVADRMDTLRRKTIVRPTAEVLAGLVGPNARASWNELAASGDTERMNAVLRFLFAAFIIDEHQGKHGRFNYGRIDIEPMPLNLVALRHRGYDPRISKPEPIINRSKLAFLAPFPGFSRPIDFTIINARKVRISA